MNTSATYHYTSQDIKKLYEQYGGIVYGYILKKTGSKKKADKIFVTAFINLKHHLSSLNDTPCTTLWFVKYAMKNCIEFSKKNELERSEKNLMYFAGEEWFTNMQQSKLK